MWVYVLELQFNHYYIGRTSNLDVQYHYHMNGTASTWTRKYSPIAILEYFIDSGFDELKTTLKYMKLYGIDKVRGSTYTETYLTPEQKSEIQRYFWSEDNLCIKCGKDHFQNSCPSSPWWKKLGTCFETETN